MDHQIESMIKDGHPEKLLDFAKDHASRIGDMIGNYRIILAQWEESNPDLLKKLLTLTWHRLDDETRRRFIHLMIGMVYRVSRSVILQRGAPTGEPIITPFNFQGDEIDLDRTLESIVENRFLSYENIFVLDRRKQKKAAVIMLDASGSMQGLNLAIAAIAAASLAMNLNYRDEYGIVIFSEKVNIFKRVGQPKHLDGVISGILDLLPEGRTDISIGLHAGLEELRRTNIQNRIGILLTDGWQNIGQDPIKIALQFPQLHVINLPGGQPVLSKKIAEAGKGCYVPINDMLDVSKAIVTCLMQ
ncbi:VWA domain-containing protein [bacterium]|nr:MAG: VWA domain-containing protein [bacterium]